MVAAQSLPSESSISQEEIGKSDLRITLVADFQTRALQQLGWHGPIPATFTECDDLIRELFADGSD